LDGGNKRRFPAPSVCLHDGGNGTEFATRLRHSLKSGGGKKKPLPTAQNKEKSENFVTRLQNFVNENIRFINVIKGPCTIFLVYLEGALNNIKCHANKHNRPQGQTIYQIN
jgi:hypothetical protein